MKDNSRDMMAKGRGRGVDEVKINSNSSFGPRRALYNKPIREQVIAKIRRFENAFVAIEGRMLSIDAKEDKLKCRIEPSIGEPILCQFEESMTEQVLRAVRKFVQVRGEAKYDTATNKITIMYIKDLELIDENLASDISNMPLSSFWKTTSFEDIVGLQGAYPINDLSSIMGGWPEDEDLDSFISFIKGS